MSDGTKQPATPDRIEQFRSLLTKNPLHPSEARYALTELFREVDQLRASLEKERNLGPVARLYQ